MNSNDIRLLYEYDRWANERTLRAASTLLPEQFTRDVGGGFGSVRDTLLHILGGQWIWLAYWKEPPTSDSLVSAMMSRRDELFNPSKFPDAKVVQSKWTEVEKELADFVKVMTDEVLEKLLPFRGMDVKLMHLMQHVANHSTYHRGQFALLMRQLRAEPLATDFHVFLVEGHNESFTEI